MVKLCKYPDKPCTDRFMSYSKGKLYCRLSEWKKKQGICPYNSEIKAVPKVIKQQLLKGQTKLC